MGVDFCSGICGVSVIRSGERPTHATALKMCWEVAVLAVS